MGEDFGPFHEGELAVQRATGERATGAANGRIIADRLVPAAVGFVARQSLAAVASVDADGRPWCSPLLGPPGSFTVPDLGRVALDRAAGRPDDPLWSNVAGDPRAGVLFLEAESRKRFRVNGRVADPDGDPIVVEVAEVFGNCPRYITRRRLSIEPARGNGTAVGAATGVHLGDDERRIIAAADTVFVASANPAGLPDASHRGGRPGFVDVRADRLWIPDYPGNSMFNTLGNLRLNPAAGLLFIDFGASESLQLTGATVLDLAVADADTAGRTGGTGRGWTFTPGAWRRAPLPRRVHADLAELSRHNP